MGVGWIAISSRLVEDLGAACLDELMTTSYNLKQKCTVFGWVLSGSPAACSDWLVRRIGRRGRL